MGQALFDDLLTRLEKLGFVLSNEMKFSTFDFIEVFIVHKRKFPETIEGTMQNPQFSSAKKI